MPLSPDQLDNWFTYHKPTDETAPKYAAIRAAEQACHAAYADMFCRFSDVKEGAGVTVADCDTVNRVTRSLAEAIDANAPDSADKTASIRCVRLARNAANEWIMSLVLGFPLHIASLEEARKQTVYARWQANSAIACGGK